MVLAQIVDAYMDIAAYDLRETYCRRLGHHVPFKYCRDVGVALPCRLIPDCWHTQFDVAAWLTEHFSPEQIAQILAPPQPKIASILGLIVKSRDQNS